MDNELAREILEELEKAMEVNGFGSVLQEARRRLEESYSEDYQKNDFETVNNPEILDRGYDWALKFILRNSIQILKSISSHSLDESINQINKHLSAESTPIDKIEVLMVNNATVDLADLPDYSQLVDSLQAILSSLNQE